MGINKPSFSEPRAKRQRQHRTQLPRSGLVHGTHWRADSAPALPPWHTKSRKMPNEALADRLAAVRERIQRAADRARRDPAGILLLAVTKIFPADAIQEAYDLGLREF